MVQVKVAAGCNTFQSVWVRFNFLLNVEQVFLEATGASDAYMDTAG